jgi:UDP-N-acetylglucosamine 2-epimerase (non-hydrolysing)
MKIINIVGARPNFMKVAPIVEAMKRRKSHFAPLLVHTGQHYDPQMSESFFRDLALPEPDVYLGVGSGSHAVQTAAVMERFEPVVVREKPDWVLVVGDVNSTLACALVCSKLGIKVVHVESGLRSRDRTMPEEINRLLTDQISDLLLTPSQNAVENLYAEGIPADRVRFVGNVMIDSLFLNMKRSEASAIRKRLGLTVWEYATVTLHRPSNVDNPETLGRIIDALVAVAEKLPVIFPVHPRTREKLEDPKIAEKLAAAPRVRLIEPLGYLDFLRLFSGSRLVLTDSGGIQEETTALSIPCLTLRENTERPITVELGTNRIVGTDTMRIVGSAMAILKSEQSANRKPPPPLWDGRTSDRILDAILEHGRR